MWLQKSSLNLLSGSQWFNRDSLNAWNQWFLSLCCRVLCGLHAFNTQAGSLKLFLNLCSCYQHLREVRVEHLRLSQVFLEQILSCPEPWACMWLLDSQEYERDFASPYGHLISQPFLLRLWSVYFLPQLLSITSGSYYVKMVDQALLTLHSTHQGKMFSTRWVWARSNKSNFRMRSSKLPPERSNSGTSLGMRSILLSTVLATQAAIFQPTTDLGNRWWTKAN